MIINLTNVIEVILFTYLSLSTMYLLIFSIAGILKPSKDENVRQKQFRKMAVFFPAYKEDDVILNSIHYALSQDYPHFLYDIIVIGDSLKKKTLRLLENLPIEVVNVSFENSTKVKALQAATYVIKKEYDVAVIMDADNLMSNDFLCKINESFDRGYMVVQGHRKAKNYNNDMAIMDSVSEEINNHIFRKGHRALKLSAALIGSGMAFDYNLYKYNIRNMTAIGGFDKELELRLLKNKIKIDYASDAIILDEKIQESKTFVNQRRRWLAAQLFYLRKYFRTGVVHLIVHGNIDFFDKVIQMALPPRIILLGILPVIFTVASLLNLIPYMNDNGVLLIPASFWGVTTILIVVSFLLAIPKRLFNRITFLTILSVPKGVYLMMKSLVGMRGANEKFIHTEHGVIK